MSNRPLDAQSDAIRPSASYPMPVRLAFLAGPSNSGSYFTRYRTVTPVVNAADPPFPIDATLSLWNPPISSETQWRSMALPALRG